MLFHSRTIVVGLILVRTKGGKSMSCVSSVWLAMFWWTIIGSCFPLVPERDREEYDSFQSHLSPQKGGGHQKQNSQSEQYFRFLGLLFKCANRLGPLAPLFEMLLFFPTCEGLGVPTVLCTVQYSSAQFWWGKSVKVTVTYMSPPILPRCYNTRPNSILRKDRGDHKSKNI